MKNTNRFIEGEEPEKSRLTRRRMLQLMGMSAAGAAWLAACGDPTATTAPATTAPAATTAKAATTAASAATTAAAAAGGTTAAASGGNISAGEVKASGKVVVGIGKDQTNTLKKVLDNFNAKNTGVTIEYQELSTNSGEVHDKLATSFAAKDSSIDLIAADLPWLPEFGSAGFLLPLDKYVNPQFRGTFFESTLLGTTYKEKLYGIPWYLDGGVLYYRKDLLEKGGVTPPNTYDELATAAMKLQTDTTYGFVVNAFKNEGLSAIWMEILWGYGGEFMNTTTNEVLVNSPEGEAAVAWLVDGIYTKKFIPDKILTLTRPQTYTVFNEGNCVFLRGWIDESSIAEGADSKIKGQWGVKTLYAAPGKKPSACLGNWSLAINANSKNPDAAWKVIEYMTGPEAQKINALGRGSPPARKDVYADPEVAKSNPTYKIFDDVFAGAKPRPVTPAYPQISSDVIQDLLTQALSKKITPKEAVQQMADKTKKILDKFKG
jgi:multiple sugar transport system substrate-binding protein